MITAISFEIFYSVLLATAAALGIIQADAMTDHARIAHADQAVNAASMIETVEAQLNGGGPCDRLDVHFCLYQNGHKSTHAKILCYQNHRRLVDGLIIGLKYDTPCVVTGFTARRQYWAKSIFTDRCVVVNINMLHTWMKIMYPGLIQ